MARALLAVPVVGVTVAAGVWVAGGVLTDDFRASMALTAAWLLLAGAACVAVAARRRGLRVAVLGTYVVVAGAIVAFLALTTLRDRVVHEAVVAGTPASALEAAPAGATAPGPRARAAPSRNLELARGAFRSGEHHTAGSARVVRLADGRRFLTLTAFATSPGPDLRVRLAPGDTDDGARDGAVDLGALKGNRGDQQYRLPDRVAVVGRSVVIWCRAFSAPFGSAPLERS